MSSLLRGALQRGVDAASDIMLHVGRRLGEDDDAYEPDAFDIAYTFLVVITILIVVTIIFETIKDLMIDSSDKYTRPIVLQLFAEMTVLGFLSLVTFACNAFGTIDYWSDEIYGNESYLEETIEKIHYTLFLVMIIAIIQVFMLVRIGNAFTKKYEEWNDMCIEHKDRIKPILERLEREGHMTWWDWFSDYFLCRNTPWGAWMKHSQREDEEALIQFYALRREFIMNRHPTPPYDLPSKDKWLPKNFDYASYQANCLSKFMVAMVTFTPLTWLALWSFIALVFLFMLIVDGQYLYLSTVWVGLAYISIGLIYLKDRKAEWVIENLLNPAFVRSADAFPDFEREFQDSDSEAEAIVSRLNKGTVSIAFRKGDKEATEDTPLVGGGAKDQEVEGLSHIMRVRKDLSTTPRWVNAKPVEPGFITKLLFGQKAMPNKQHGLMWGDLAGPEVQTYILRVFLLIQALYVSVLAVYFSPYMYYHYGDSWGTVYLLVAIVPEFILYLGFYPRLIMNMTQIASTGLLKQTPVVNEVVRMQKTQKMVRTIMMLTKLKAASKKQKRNAADYKPKEYDLTDPDVKAKYDTFVKIFKTYDVDGSGDVDSKELGMMLKTMGMSLSEEELGQMFILLDLDGDGTVSLQEFVEWNMENEETDPSKSEEELKELARTIFEMFDEDGSGEITVEEFKTALEKMNAGLTLDEICAIVKDFDEDGSGEISLEEFEKVIEKAVNGE